MNAPTLHDVILQPRDPVMLRDARPFTADPGARAVTLDWPLPQTAAGLLRTLIGNTLPDGFRFNWTDRGPTGGPAMARKIAVHGPLLLVQRPGENGWTVFAQAPADAVLWGDDPLADAERERNVLRRRPLLTMPDGGCDLPAAGIRPALPERYIAKSLLIEGVRFWAVEDIVAHLAGKSLSHPRPAVCGAIPQETRVHVQIDHQSQTHAEGALFSTRSLTFAEAPHAPSSVLRKDRAAMALLCRIAPSPGVEDVLAAWNPREGAGPFGGEHRITAIRPDVDDLWPAFEKATALPENAERLLLYLATPALFEHGWLPGWLDTATLQGTPPGLNGVTLKLESACITDRLVSVSGWDLEQNVPRAIRHAVPAGSLYFFSVVGGALTSTGCEALWLRPVSDDPQDCRDGYGLALPGIWNPAP